MVKITNGIDTYKVTKGAYDSIFKKQGYRIVEEMKSQNSGNENVNSEIDENETAMQELEEKPISQWTKEEVKKYAKHRKINISGTENVNEAKEIIIKYLNK